MHQDMKVGSVTVHPTLHTLLMSLGNATCRLTDQGADIIVTSFLEISDHNSVESAVFLNWQTNKGNAMQKHAMICLSKVIAILFYCQMFSSNDSVHKC